MPIVYARLEPEWYRRFEDLGQSTILMFDPMLESSGTTIGDQYRRLDPTLRACDAVVFRGAAPSLLPALQSDPIVQHLVGARPVAALVGRANRSQLEFVTPAGFSVPESLPTLDEFRTAELTAILERRGAIFRSDEYHFALPSGQHARQFIRLADALRNLGEVERFVDWLLGALNGDALVLGDTGSTLPLLLCLREQARSRFAWNVEIGTLEEYPTDALALSDAVRRLNSQPAVVSSALQGGTRELLFVVSVSSTGRLCKLFKSLAPPGSKVAVICNAGEQPSCDFVLLKLPVESWAVGPDGRCVQCNVTPCIPIDGSTYARLPAISWEKRKLTPAVAMENRQFWTIADAADAVRLHVDVTYLEGGRPQSRHFGIFLDTRKLIGRVEFRTDCLDSVKRVGPVDAVIIPSHENSDIVRDLVLEAYPAARAFFIPPGRMPEEVAEALRDAQHILVADDAIITGATLEYLRSEVYRVTQAHGTAPRVKCFVFVSRPSHVGVRDALRRRYHGLACGVEILLPHGSKCPWCEERRLLGELRRRLDREDDALTLERVQLRIRKLEAELQPPLLMTDDRDAHAGFLTKDSFFGELRQKAAFAAGVSATQRVRNDLETIGGIQVGVLDLGTAISAYFEGILLSAILRTLNRKELRLPGGDPPLDEEIGRIDPSRAYPGVLTEIAWAAVTGKVPVAAVKSLPERSAREREWLTMLLRLLQITEPV